MGLKESYKQLVEQGLKAYHLKQIGIINCTTSKQKEPRRVCQKKGGKLTYLTADPDWWKPN